MRRRSRGLRLPHLPGQVSARRRRELALVFALIFGAGAGATPVAAVAVPFTTQPAISTSADLAAFVYGADIDGDGDLDAISASIDDDKIAWYENVDGDGSSWVEDVVSTVADAANSVFAADVDGDGDLDILSSSAVDDAIAWYENENGDGSAWGATTISATADSATSVVAADIDGDGDTDVVSASNGDDKIAWYENENGLGTSWTPRTIATDANGASQVFAADIDGDGDLDVASASLLDDKIAWHENVNGAGTSWTTRNVFTLADSARGVAAADIDGDGDADLVSVAVNDDLVLWHENLNGLGTSWSTATITNLADQARGVFAADVDGDGDVDALSASRLDDEVAWYENVAGDGSSWTRRLLSTVAYLAYSVFAGDVDGDGDVDVLSTSADLIPTSSVDDEITWYENETIHRSALLEETVTIGTSGNGAFSVFAADVDGDGDEDALSASTLDNEIAWYENELGDGTSWTPRTIASDVETAYSVFAADVDGDGDLDALSVAANGNEVAWHENELGNGTSWTPRTIATTAAGPVSVFAADVDGDGDLDALSASITDDEIAWYENENGAGTSWTPRTIANTALGARSVFAADVDGDGDVDVLSVSADDDEVAWYENESGDGTSWTPRTIATTADSARGVFAADVDGDGDVDALSVSSLDNEIAWYENESGDGTSWTPRTITSVAIDARAIFAADLDADGDVDAMSGTNIGDAIAWYENELGDGTSWTARTIATTAHSARSVFAADVDGDGDVDALSASFGDDTIAWYPNVGGQFALPTTALAQGVIANSQEDVALQIDLEHRGRTGDSDVELETIELLFENGSGSPLTGTQGNALIAKLELFLDDGSSVFEFPGDTLVALVDPLVLVSGVQSIDFVLGDLDVQVAVGESKRYFVVITMTANAQSQIPGAFELFHVTEASSTARDASAPAVPLRLEYHADTTTGLVSTALSSATCKAPFDLDLHGFLVVGNVVCEAGTTIRAGNGLLVKEGGDLTLRAGQRVRFVTDFSVLALGKLTVEIDPSLEP